MADEDYVEESDFALSSEDEYNECKHSATEAYKSASLHQTSRVTKEHDKVKCNKGTSKTCGRCGKTLRTDFCLCVYKIPLQCEKCFKYVENLAEFQAHMKTHATVSSSLITRTSELQDKISSNTSSDDRVYRCTSCKECFSTQLGLMAHSLNHRIATGTTICKCPHCNREFTSTARLGIHITRMHSEEREFLCKVCNKAFSSSNTLDAHKRLHLGIKPYKCDECGKSYSQSGNLAYHKSTHSGVKSYVCHLCGKSFLTIGILANHERRHSGIKPFVCDLCGRAFADNYGLTHHKVVHSGVRSFMCDICGKAFMHKYTLSSHKRIHSGEKRYKCSICDRAFTQMSTMLQHRNTHTGEKSFPCLCGKSFTQQSSLARHKRMHRGIIEYFFCNVCDKKFSYKSTLYKHKRRAHGINNTCAKMNPHLPIYTQN